MNKKIKFLLIISILCVSLFINNKDKVQAMTVDKAGEYMAEFAINFFDAHASETRYGTGGRASAYQGKKSGGYYEFDCVGWISFVIHQTLDEYGAASYTDFVVPYGPGNNAYYRNGFKEVHGSLGSRKAIPLQELKSILKPGDIVCKTAKHVMLYVGDNTLIHCTGHGPGAEYGGDLGYGLIKESLDHFYGTGAGIEVVGRITEDAASKINESNCTTVFGQPGTSLTGSWRHASSGGNPVASASTVTAANKFAASGMNEDYTLGLRYPKDNKNTPLNSFIDFTLPFLQTWMIPLAMNSGALNTAGADDGVKNPMFSYITIKEAMSDILVNRYDITKCTLKTKYKVYDLITYQVTHDDEGNKSTTEISRQYIDESLDGPMAEEYVSKSFDVNTKYCIKKANTFDTKITNEFTYEKYKDYDVENRIEGGTGFVSKTKEDGAAYHEGGDPGGGGSYTYIVKDGHYINVTRIWEDIWEQGDSEVVPYTVDDVKEYIESGGMQKPNKSTTTSISTDGTIYNCKKYELSEEDKIELAKLVNGEDGSNPDGMKAVASHICNLYEMRIKYGIYRETQTLVEHAHSGWYDEGSFTRGYSEESLQAVEQCIVNGQRTIPPYVNEFCTYTSQYISPFYGQDIDKYVIGETEVTQLFSGNPHGPVMAVFPTSYGGNIFFYTDESYKQYCESQYTTTGDGEKSTTTSKVTSIDKFVFLGDSMNHGLKESGKLSGAEFISVMSSTPGQWLDWIEGKQTKWDQNVDFSDETLPDENDVNGVCITLGADALNSTQSVEDTISQMKLFIDKISSRYDSKPVYIQKLLPVRSGDKVSNSSDLNSRIKTFNSEISSYASSKGILFIDATEEFSESNGELKEDKSEDGMHLKNYDEWAEKVKNKILKSDATNNPSANVDVSGLEDFNYTDLNYYKLLYMDKEINRVDMANARPENYLQYLKKGSQYSNHVGYSRGYLAFSYSELKRLFKDKFEGSVPFVYGSSLGYKTFTAEYVMDAGTVSGVAGDSTSIAADASFGSLEKDPNKKNILLIAGHFTEDREIPGTSGLSYTEPQENRNLVTELAGAIEVAGMNPVIANRVLAHDAGKGDYQDKYGVIWGDEDVYSTSSTKIKELFEGYDHVIEIHHNATEGLQTTAHGALLMQSPKFSVTELDNKLLDCIVNNNMENTKQNPITDGLKNMNVFYDMGIQMTYLEVEFYNNKEAMDIVTKNYGKIAGEMAMVLREHFGVTTPIEGNLSNSNELSYIEQVDLLAKLINGEARGEPYEGQVAVGAVVLNRVKSPEFPNTIKEVIYQENQFSCIKDGQFDKPIDENSTVRKAAEEALSGSDPSEGALFFYNPATAKSDWLFTLDTIKTIGNHRFANS